MSPATPPLRKLATRLIDFEAKDHQPPEPNVPAVVHVCEKLRPQLATLMGQGGFRAIVSRAIAVARADTPWLETVAVNADGALEGWDKVDARVGAEELKKSGVILIAQMLCLLVAFIGSNLTLRLVREVWPGLSLEDLNFTKEDHP